MIRVLSYFMGVLTPFPLLTRPGPGCFTIATADAFLTRLPYICDSSGEFCIYKWVGPAGQNYAANAEIYFNLSG